MQIAIAQPTSGPRPEPSAPSIAAPASAIAFGLGRVPPTLLLVLAIVFVQLGSALATVLFSSIGPTGTAFASTLFSAAVVTALQAFGAMPGGRLTLAEMARTARSHWRLVVLFGGAISLLNLPYFLALERLPLGIVATVTFLGPLGLAVATSRKVVHFFWIGIAAVGVALLTPETGTHLDPLGLLYAAVAACAWAAFVPLSKRASAAFPGQAGLACGLWIASLLLLAPAFIEGSLVGAGLSDIAGALAVSLLGVVLPTVLEFEALKNMSARTYGILVTLEPAVGALVGVICLSQPAGGRMLIAVACVMLSAVGVTLSDRRDVQ
jgi:inner membrane transporter RhtA